MSLSKHSMRRPPVTKSHQAYFDSVLDRLPTRAGFVKWVCGALWHVDRDLAATSDKCPQCGSVCHPLTGYREARTEEESSNG